MYSSTGNDDLVIDHQKGLFVFDSPSVKNNLTLQVQKANQLIIHQVYI